MLKKILIVVVVALIGLLTFAAFQPAEYSISRELVMKAPAEAIFPFINNSQKSNSWMPWSEVDPNAKMSYSGPDEGVGSKSSWEGNGQLGVGEALVVESNPNQNVKTQLTYTKPMHMSQMAEISLTPATEGTLVKWTVSGQNSFVGRLMCVFMNMDKMVGSQFEKGLTKLKSMVETPQ